jgi:hypothetical protein
MRRKLQELMELYYEVKEELRRSEPQFYERWKAGGFLVDNDIYSMYPCLEKLMEDMDEEDETEETEE